MRCMYRIYCTSLCVNERDRQRKREGKREGEGEL
jgi:hypothetical protein